MGTLCPPPLDGIGLSLLNPVIPHDSSIDLFCSFLALCKSFFEIFCILAIFFGFIFNNFNNLLRLLSASRLLSYLLSVSNNYSVDIICGPLIPLFFAIRSYSLLVNWIIFELIFYIIQRQNYIFKCNYYIFNYIFLNYKSNYVFKKLIILIIKVYMWWLCILLCTLIYNFMCIWLFMFIYSNEKVFI